MARPKGTKTKLPVAAKRKIDVSGQIEGLALEACSVLCGAMRLYGISAARQKKLFNRASTSTRRPPAMSESLLQQFYDISDLLAAWAREVTYLDSTGKPKVLPIKGKDQTFSSLARRFLPARPLKEVVDLACSSVNVGKVHGNKIALLGEPMMKLSDHPSASLAQIVSHIANIVSTVESNRSRAKRNSRAGRLERIVKYPLTSAQFEAFRRSIRPQLNALTEQADHLLDSLVNERMRSRRSNAVGGLGLYLYHREKGHLPPSPRSKTRTRLKRSRR